MKQFFLCSFGVMLAACGNDTGATPIASDTDAAAQSDIAGTDAVADAESDTLADGLNDVATSDLVDIKQCLPLMADCKNNSECCSPNLCMNITGTLKCQQEGPMQDIQQPDVLDTVWGDVDTGPCSPQGYDAPVCSGTGALSFPSFPKTCTTDAECFVAEHQINCCGTKVAWGLNVCAESQFSSAEKQCDGQYPGCGCAEFPTQAEDGYTSSSNGDLAAQCVSGTCRSFVKNAKPNCVTQGGLQDPAPVKSCSTTADCDFSMKTIDCCGSMAFIGIAKFAKAAYDVEQQKCANTISKCDCVGKPTTLEDGKVLTTDAVPLQCLNGSCLTGTY
jgi:hypothetical protein